MTVPCFHYSDWQIKKKSLFFFFKKKGACGFVFLPLWQLSSSVSEEEATGNNHLCLVCLGPEGLTGLMGHGWPNHV